MDDKSNLFFELLRVSIGCQASLSRPPLIAEWESLYNLALKQSLTGICFAGIQQLNSSDLSHLPQPLYLRWMGITANIQHRNEALGKKCEVLLKTLGADRIEAYLLKGQSLNPYYGNLGMLRPSGDIDVWCKHQSITSLVEYVGCRGFDLEAKYVHVGYKYEDVEVELHPIPAILRCPWNNLKLRRWFDSFSRKDFDNSSGIVLPSIDFNLVFLMVHMYNHVMKDGVGLKQILDYYFILLLADENQRNEAKLVMESVGMSQFTSAVMYIMKTVFCLSSDKLLCEPNEKLGVLLLGNMMNGGSFGQYDNQYKELKSGNLFIRGLGGLRKKAHLFCFGPWEVICSPFWSVWQVSWRKIHGYM